MKFIYSLIVCSCALTSIAQNKVRPPYTLFIEPYLDSIPQIFGSGFISDRYNNRDLAISPDGLEIYFTLQDYKKDHSFILVTKWLSGRWTKPEIAPFSGRYSDLEPSFSPDGKRLYFASNRPVGPNGTKTDYDIWYIQKNSSEWSEPVNMGEPVNTQGNEFYPSVTANGNLYFTAERANGIGKEDIFVCKMQNGVYTKAEPVGDSINTENYEFNAYVDPEENFIIFTAFGKDDFGGGDLYISKRKDGKSWSRPINMGSLINSPYLDYCPAISPDGQYFFYTSSKKMEFRDDMNIDELKILLNMAENGLSDIYVIPFRVYLESVPSY